MNIDEEEGQAHVIYTTDGPNAGIPDHYAILGISPVSTMADVLRAAKTKRVSFSKFPLWARV